jgi:hypothetical protein
MLDLYDNRQPIDVITLKNQLKKHKKLSQAGEYQVLVGYLIYCQPALMWKITPKLFEKNISSEN